MDTFTQPRSMHHVIYMLIIPLFTVTLQAVWETVTARDTDSNVELRCETTGFIRPDADLQWYHEDELVTNNRTSVIFIDGSPHTAQRGGNDTAPGRVSVLRISTPAVTDTGMYTCRVQGTKESANVQLIVEAGGGFCNDC